MGNRTWTKWNWEDDPEAPRTWKAPEEMAVIVERWLGDPRVMTDVQKQAVEAWRTVSGIGPVAETEQGPMMICIEPITTLRWLDQVHVTFGKRVTPAIEVKTQADLNPDILRALSRVRSTHRALVLSPAEELELDPPTCPKCWGHDAEEEDGTLFCREHAEEMCSNSIIDPFAIHNKLPADMVVVDGPLGTGAWRMAPAWVEKARMQCAEEGVPFAFTGWGRWVPREHLDGLAYRIGDDGRTRVADARSEHGSFFYDIGPTVGGRLLNGTQHDALPEGL